MLQEFKGFPSRSQFTPPSLDTLTCETFTIIAVLVRRHYISGPYSQYNSPTTEGGLGGGLWGFVCKPPLQRDIIMICGNMSAIHIHGNYRSSSTPTPNLSGTKLANLLCNVTFYPAVSIIAPLPAGFPGRREGFVRMNEMYVCTKQSSLWQFPLGKTYREKMTGNRWKKCTQNRSVSFWTDGWPSFNVEILIWNVARERGFDSVFILTMAFEKRIGSEGVRGVGFSLLCLFCVSRRALFTPMQFPDSLSPCSSRSGYFPPLQTRSASFRFQWAFSSFSPQRFRDR